MNNEKNRFYKFCIKLFKFVFRKIYKVKIIGEENIPKEGAVIIAGNHKHYFDPCLVYISTDRKINYLVKNVFYEKRILRIAFKKLDCFPVQVGKNNLQSMKNSLKVLKNNGVIGIFPEGTRNRTENFLLPFRKGAASLAQKSNAYIVPFGITGDYKIGNKNLTIRFGKAFKVNDIELEEANEKLYNEVKELMETNLKMH